jgi:hypothetical protein
MRRRSCSPFRKTVFGSIKDYAVEKLMRDAKIMQL